MSDNTGLLLQGGKVVIKRYICLAIVVLFFISCGQDSGQNSTESISSATLSWNPPTTNVDGTNLTDLAGYKIYYGTTSGEYKEVLDVNDPKATEYTIATLPPGTYYFVATAYDVIGNESSYSNEVSKTIN